MIALVRCCGWNMCFIKTCCHYKIQLKDHKKLKPEWCSATELFVKDIPAAETNPELECDPNLVFRVKRGDDLS